MAVGRSKTVGKTDLLEGGVRQLENVDDADESAVALDDGKVEVVSDYEIKNRKVSISMTDFRNGHVVSKTDRASS